MTDDDVRALVREAIQRHLGASPPGASPVGTPGIPATPGTVQSLSFSRYKLQRVSDDGMCLIEPAVRCNHCGYCECHGH
jgi:hypothetical protein